jgi:hypothetical protein
MDVYNVYTEDGTTTPSSAGSVAGISEATNTYTAIRKPSGYQTADWINESRGISTEDSQWWVILNGTGTEVFSTVGNYGDYSISITAKENTTAVVNSDDLTISVPWEALRGESVTDTYIDFGDGMAWTFVRDSLESADSAFTRVQDGDLLNVYAFGDDVETVTYTFKVLDAASDLAIARSKTRVNNGVYATSAYLNITEDDAVMDSILNNQYQLRIDTLLKYIEIPTGASYEIVFIDEDETRVDLMDGDIFRVTSADKSKTKDYYIEVNDYGASTSTTLNAITWPDYDKSYYYEWEFFNGDTIPDFTSNNKNYSLTLPSYYTTVPALKAIASDLNSVVKIDRATSVTGSLEERTTTITVYAESSDTLYSEYSVVFDLDVETQLTDVEPFFSVMLTGRYNFDCYVQIVNPNNGSEVLDLSKYLVVNAAIASDEFNAITNYQSPTTPTDADVHYSYVPGCKFNYDTNGSDDPTEWTWKNGVEGGITADPNTNADVTPGDVFVISSYDGSLSNESANFQGDSTYKFVDINLYDNVDFPNEVKTSCVAQYLAKTRALFLYKILNDSITNGTKGIWDSADDYELVDRIQWNTADTAINGNTTISANGVVYGRKSYVQKGNTEYGGGFHSLADSCDFYYYGRQAGHASGGFKINGTQLGQFIGLHTMDAITSHLSTVTSSVYAVDLGYEGDLSIVGDVSSHTVEVFMSNLDKSDSLQSLTVMSGDVAKDSASLVVDGDILVVISADSTNTTSYLIESRTLSSNTNLQPVTDLGIVVDNDNLTLSGFDYTKSIADVLAGVTTVDASSIINVIDENDELVSLLTHSLDTLLVDPIIVTLVYSGVQFEVIAEDGTIAKYELIADENSSDAYLTSNYFTVDQSSMSVSGVDYGYSVSTFLSCVTPCGNATMLLKNKIGTVRTDGLVHYDDYVEVTSEDGSNVVKYYINIYGEVNMDTKVGVNDISLGSNNSLVYAYPNPTSSILNISNATIGSVVQVISLSGVMMYSVVVEDTTSTIDMSTMRNGVYLVRFVEKDNSSVVRVVKY